MIVSMFIGPRAFSGHLSLFPIQFQYSGKYVFCSPDAQHGNRVICMRNDHQVPWQRNLCRKSARRRSAVPVLCDGRFVTVCSIFSDIPNSCILRYIYETLLWYACGLIISIRKGFPFDTAELEARIRNAPRNSNRWLELGSILQGRFKMSALEIDYDAKRLFVDGQGVKLTQTEYNIVSLLSKQAGKVMTYAEIIQVIRGVERFRKPCCR